MKGIGEIHQTFLPKGFLGAVNDNPYKLDVAKAKELLAKAGLPDGFKVTMDVRNTQPVTGIAQAIQQTLAQAGIKIEIIPGDGKQTLTKYRARTARHLYRPVGPGLSGPEHQCRDLRLQPGQRGRRASPRRSPGAMPGRRRS